MEIKRPPLLLLVLVASLQEAAKASCDHSFDDVKNGVVSLGSELVGDPIKKGH